MKANNKSMYKGSNKTNISESQSGIFLVNMISKCIN